MKKTRFTEAQIIGILKEAKAGAGTTALGCKHGISEMTLYRWQVKYAGMTVAEIRRLRALALEHTRLKKRLAEAELDKAAL